MRLCSMKRPAQARKMSATSRTGRLMRPLPPRRLGQPVSSVSSGFGAAAKSASINGGRSSCRVDRRGRAVVARRAVRRRCRAGEWRNSAAYVFEDIAATATRASCWLRAWTSRPSPRASATLPCARPPIFTRTPSEARTTPPRCVGTTSCSRPATRNPPASTEEQYCDESGPRKSLEPRFKESPRRRLLRRAVRRQFPDEDPNAHGSGARTTFFCKKAHSPWQRRAEVHQRSCAGWYLPFGEKGARRRRKHHLSRTHPRRRIGTLSPKFLPPTEVRLTPELLQPSWRRPGPPE